MLKFYNSQNTEELKAQALSRNKTTPKHIEEAVANIIDDVKKCGDEALKRFTKKFDDFDLGEIVVPHDEIALARKRLKLSNTVLYDSLLLAAKRIEDYHNHQKREGFRYKTEMGSVIGQRVMPLERVGIYVPGGTAAYPSSVLMNAIPARIAGVKEIVMAVPPGFIFSDDGTVRDAILTAADIAGATKIVAVGGAQAVAALAFGTESVPKVDKICGPGNIYVATAKRQVFGAVDIDMIAGPSEVLIIADDNANPEYVAADMLSQAEHDVMASSVLLCLSRTFAKKVEKCLDEQLANLSRNEIAAASLKDFGFAVICKDLKEAAEISNEFAPEHLEILTDDPMALLDRITNAGSVFLGEYSPEPLGDYIAGPNHVLPTSGSARFFSPLSVESYYKRSSFIMASKEEFMTLKNSAAVLAETEGLTAHKASLLIRK